MTEWNELLLESWEYKLSRCWLAPSAILHSAACVVSGHQPVRCFGSFSADSDFSRQVVLLLYEWSSHHHDPTPPPTPIQEESTQKALGMGE